ncbi:MAG: hypothetical protein LIP11_08960 [Clostridiales bacterium]|nr:hypothetical protein [Clostridiales bacterium]
MHYCNQLFKVERTLKDLSADDRKAKRLELETPIWASFWSWLKGTMFRGDGYKNGNTREQRETTDLTEASYLVTEALYTPDYLSFTKDCAF